MLLDRLEARSVECHSIMVVRHGHVVAEGWWAPYSAGRPHLLYSLTKSFTSVAVGLAIADGLLSLDDRVVDVLPDHVPAGISEQGRRITVHHLLSMTSGHNLLGATIAETVFEARVGGHIYDRAEDGSECRWARILAYEPPSRVVFSWDVGVQRRIEADTANAGELEVRFIEESPGPDPGGAGAPAHRPARARLGVHRRQCGRRPGLAALPEPVCRALRLSAPPPGGRPPGGGRTVAAEPASPSSHHVRESEGTTAEITL
ncbi:serine hydrolase [Nonomuraea sp. MCN248]|uniref:Serine hydrolase n=1 Tax=Nonomuraea corallina TaxID=2989783 RepID=A0ABT4SDT3_9ACTN|nr:serine hydrolase [Nonomuraea corallina]MDA0635135.1 serine hydrolase [Nonomuraea corallina]